MNNTERRQSEDEVDMKKAEIDLEKLEICRNSVSSLLSCAFECISNYLVQVDKKGNLW